MSDPAPARCMIRNCPHKAQEGDVLCPRCALKYQVDTRETCRESRKQTESAWGIELASALSAMEPEKVSQALTCVWVLEMADGEERRVPWSLVRAAEAELLHLVPNLFDTCPGVAELVSFRRSNSVAGISRFVRQAARASELVRWLRKSSHLSARGRTMAHAQGGDTE